MMVNTIKTGLRLIVILVFLSTGVHPLPAQNENRPDPAYQLGLQYERSGDYESALKLFQELYRRNPDDSKYLPRIEQNLKNLKRYEELVALLEDRLIQKPGDMNVLGQIADVYLKWGRMEPARAYFDKILVQGSNNPFLYTFISNLLIQNRMFEEAIELLQNARKKLNNNNLFHFDLARLYGWHRNYKASADEYLLIVQNEPRNYQIVEREFMNFPGDSATVRQILQSIDEISVLDPDNIQLLQLKAGYFLRHRMYERAFESFVKLDKLFNADGKQILDFAQQAFRQDAYGAAAEAYQYIIENYPGRDQVSDAEFGLAYSYEQRGTVRDDFINAAVRAISQERSENLSRAIDRYRRILQANPGTPWAQNAFYRIGEIQFEQLFNIDEAIRAYASAVQVNPESPAGKVALKRLADCFVVRGDVNEAFNTYGRVMESARESAPELSWDARFYRAEIEYFRGDFTAARAVIDTLLKTVPPSSRLYNDILTRSGFLAEHLPRDSAALGFFARGELLAKQRERAQAIALFEDILKRFPESSLASGCHYQAGIQAMELGNGEKAVEHFERIKDDYGDSYYADRAYKRIGEIYAWIFNDRERAMKTFEDFLVAFPTSVYLDDVRAEIRRLEQ